MLARYGPFFFLCKLFRMVTHVFFPALVFLSPPPQVLEGPGRVRPACHLLLLLDVLPPGPVEVVQPGQCQLNAYICTTAY